MSTPTTNNSRSRPALLQAKGERFGEKVYLCANGRRHYVPSVERLKQYGLAWPEDLHQVPDEVLMAYKIGGWLPALLPNSKPAAIRSSMTMREYMAAELRGIGLEVGAGASPFPVPIDCTVLFGDRLPHDELVRTLYPGQGEFELVKPDLITEFDDFRGIADSSLDFVIGCHVIEHVFDPIGTLVHANRILKPGGSLLLVVPDADRTFDRDRPLTQLDHLVLDHTDPDSSRDYSHYEEFYTLAFKTPSEQLKEKVDQQFRARGDLHVHVWSYESFRETVDYVDRHLVRWSKIWSQPTLPDKKSDIEFYFKLTK